MHFLALLAIAAPLVVSAQNVHTVVVGSSKGETKFTPEAIVCLPRYYRCICAYRLYSLPPQVCTCFHAWLSRFDMICLQGISLPSNSSRSVRVREL